MGRKPHTGQVKPFDRHLGDLFSDFRALSTARVASEDERLTEYMAACCPAATCRAQTLKGPEALPCPRAPRL